EKNGYSVNTVTDTEGYYYLDSVRWGPNQVNLYHPRYETASKYADVIRDKTVEIDFEVDRLDEYVDPVLTVRVVNGNGDPVNQAILDLYQLKQSTYEYFFYLGTQTTDTDGQAEFTLPRLYEEEVIEFQLRVAAYGYFDHVRDFAVSWTVPDPVLTIVMDAL
ncbi:hypothetical protein JXA80_03875, partial [bacterium]|nr:hypothetical protein [candidate division CSSED10-310 bacterium]